MLVENVDTRSICAGHLASFAMYKCIEQRVGVYSVYGRGEKIEHY